MKTVSTHENLNMVLSLFLVLSGSASGQHKKIT